MKIKYVTYIGLFIGLILLLLSLFLTNPIVALAIKINAAGLILFSIIRPIFSTKYDEELIEEIENDEYI